MAKIKSLGNRKQRSKIEETVGPTSTKRMRKTGVLKPGISLVVAMTKSRIIGFSNRLPWHLPEDLRHFRRLTIHRPIVMGRKTFESIGRALPKRRNIVITRRKDLQIAGVDTFGSLSEALKACGPETRVCVIGGGEIFREALPLADRINLTVIYLEEHQSSLFGPFLGDKFFPSISPREWQIEHIGPRRRAKSRSPSPNLKSPHGYLNNVFFRFVDLVRVRRPSRKSTIEDEQDFNWLRFKQYDSSAIPLKRNRKETGHR